MLKGHTLTPSVFGYVDQCKRLHVCGGSSSLSGITALVKLYYFVKIPRTVPCSICSISYMDIVYLTMCYSRVLIVCLLNL